MNLGGLCIFMRSVQHSVCIIQVGQHGNLLLPRVNRLDSAEQCRGEAELLVVSRWCLFFFLCLLGGLAQAGLPQGFRAIYRDTAPFIWWRQSRAELADSHVTIPKFNPGHQVQHPNIWSLPTTNIAVNKSKHQVLCVRARAILTQRVYTELLSCRSDLDFSRKTLIFFTTFIKRIQTWTEVCLQLSGRKKIPLSHLVTNVHNECSRGDGEQITASIMEMGWISPFSTITNINGSLSNLLDLFALFIDLFSEINSQT